MRLLPEIPTSTLLLLAALTAVLTIGCGSGDGLTNVNEGMSQAEIDAYMERSEAMSEKVAEAEARGGRDG